MRPRVAQLPGRQPIPPGVLEDPAADGTKLRAVVVREAHERHRVPTLEPGLWVRASGQPEEFALHGIRLALGRHTAAHPAIRRLERAWLALVFIVRVAAQGEFRLLRAREHVLHCHHRRREGHEPPIGQQRALERGPIVVEGDRGDAEAERVGLLGGLQARALVVLARLLRVRADAIRERRRVLERREVEQNGRLSTIGGGRHQLTAAPHLLADDARFAPWQREARVEDGDAERLL